MAIGVLVVTRTAPLGPAGHQRPRSTWSDSPSKTTSHDRPSRPSLATRLAAADSASPAGTDPRAAAARANPESTEAGVPASIHAIRSVPPARPSAPAYAAAS